MTTARRIVLFFMVAYALTWFGNLGNWLLPSPYWPVPMNSFGPILAAPLVLWLTAGTAELRRWGRRILRFRAPWRIYAAAAVPPAIIPLVSVLIAGQFLAPAQSPDWAGLPELLLIMPLIALVFGPVGEEPAFRGHAMHELQQTMSPLAASLLVGLGVLVWHAPVFLLGTIELPIAVAIVAVSVVYGWLYQASGSIWPPVVLHTVQNTIGGEFLHGVFAPGDVWVWNSILAAFYVGWAVLLAWRLGPTLGHGVRTE